VTLYAETSAVLRWLFAERDGDAILEQLRAADKVVCSRLTGIEARRVIRRAVREGRITEVEAAGLRAQLALAAARWAVLEVTRDVAARAEEAFPSEPLRTLDALHLASALELRQSLPDLVVLSTDARVRANAAQLGLVVLPDE
jgi:uncharacterized protein with PIN domain